MPNWDNDIDIVARGMTAGEPDRALRARVLARLDEPRRIWRSPWILSPVAVAAAAVVAVMVFRAPEQVRLKPDTTEAQVRLKPDATPEPTVRLKPDTTPEPTVRLKPDTTSTPYVASAFTRTETIATLARNDDMESIAPAPLEIDPIDIDDITAMESIDTPRLAVAPLEIPAIGGQ